MRFLTASILAAAAFVGPTALAAPESPAGVWMTEEKNSKVRIAPCGKAMCATIIWAKKVGTDENNPDPALRNRNIIGTDLSRDMKPDSKGGWSGSIYNPENGKTYQASMQRVTDKELEVSGCILGGLLCGSETWTRQGDNTASVAPASEKTAKTR
ncbi:DUF2147 domain-containing protein [Enterovirga sp.]|jgi:uncharacterized protein (DUF2147 family)|uniref:DUF2147 domain-containing protein n=1 Tax=Enterovirga sp. TaxID=2026350 RepID=UPI0026305643|nr:DUF2147 domain-containing protein [Enterovirga sp.]MDB5589716.1 hypothetical protein [Enterovirga sp.]